MRKVLLTALPLVFGLAQPAWSQSSGHSGHQISPPADPHAAHRAQAAQDAQDAEAEEEDSEAQTPLLDPHAGHVMPATAPSGEEPLLSPPADAPDDPHAGHTMEPPTPAQTDPHAGHSAPPSVPDPHTGHTMAPPAPDPHAGHDMAPPTSPQDDPHAGHARPSPPAGADPHAGHDMNAQGAPDVLTSADNPGRPPETPPPATAFRGPAHAADLYFSAAEMAEARELLRHEQGEFTTTTFIAERLELRSGDEASYLWDLQGWYGGDINRFWWKAEGEGVFDGDLESAELQALYSRAFTPYFDFQAGVRQDIGGESDRTHLVVGVQGLAPYFFEVDAAAFLSTEGELTARLEAEFDLRLTQRLILQPRAEAEFSAQDIPELGIGSGLSSLEAGLRLRYEIRREFAPYIGVEWETAVGSARDFARARGEDPDASRLVIGLRTWF